MVDMDRSLSVDLQLASGGLLRPPLASACTKPRSRQGQRMTQAAPWKEMLSQEASTYCAISLFPPGSWRSSLEPGNSASESERIYRVCGARTENVVNCSRFWRLRTGKRSMRIAGSLLKLFTGSRCAKSLAARTTVSECFSSASRARTTDQ